MIISEIKIANPSPYERSDFVQVDISSVAKNIPENHLALFRLSQGREYRIPHQIDLILGKNNSKIILTFFCERLEAGRDDYSDTAAIYILKKTKKEQKIELRNNGLDIIFDDRQGSVNLKNKNIFEVSIKYKTTEGQAILSGSATSITHGNHILGNVTEMLSPFQLEDGNHPKKRWGQVTSLVFFPLPWDHQWFQRFDLKTKKYELVHYKVGSMRAVITLKSPPITIPYDGGPFFQPIKEFTKGIRCSLYRVIYIYPGKNPFYMEELFVLTEVNEYSLGFRAYYTSDIYPATLETDFKQMRSIPDYFIAWKNWNNNFLGYGFASDSHVRGVETIDNNEIRWRLQLTHYHRTIHYFMVENHPQLINRSCPDHPFQTIGHDGWYEKIFKPIGPVDFALRFPPCYS